MIGSSQQMIMKIRTTLLMRNGWDYYISIVFTEILFSKCSEFGLKFFALKRVGGPNVGATPPPPSRPYIGPPIISTAQVRAAQIRADKVFIVK